MAALWLSRHGILRGGTGGRQQLNAVVTLLCSRKESSSGNESSTGARTFATKAEKRKGIDRKKPPPILESHAESIASRGFLRPYKPYDPPTDVDSRMKRIISTFFGSSANNLLDLGDLKNRYQFLSTCFTEFQHSVPNSLLHTMKTVGDVISFYQTPVNTTTPLDKFKTMDLPENMHVQYEYHRWHPSTDTKFGGVTAFPRSSTIVTGLKYKDKYKGHRQSTEWPFK